MLKASAVEELWSESHGGMEVKEAFRLGWPRAESYRKASGLELW